MNASSPRSRRPPVARAVQLALLATLLATLDAACGPPRPPPGQEEIATAAEDVPAAVRLTAARIGERLGGAQAETWFWDTESEDWECALVGLTRQAELDVTPDGTFAELELVYSMAEVEAALPDVAEFIRRQCRDDPDVFIELSLRRELLLSPLPELADAWTQSGVVIEFQCSNGRDFEFDARHQVEEHRMDDVGEQGGQAADEH